MHEPIETRGLDLIEQPNDGRPRVEGPLDFLTDEMAAEMLQMLARRAEPRNRGASLAVAVSLILHALLVVWIIRNYHPISANAKQEPVPRYIELMRKNDAFTEAPGRKIDKAPLNAPLSDGNRKAAMPKPTGETATQRPGDGGVFQPPMQRAQQAAQAEAETRVPQPQQQQQPTQNSEQTPQQQVAAANAAAQTFVYRPSSTPAAQTGAIDWKSAINKVASASGGSDQPLDLNQAGGGGEKGFADNGPLSFESDWFDWGDYAQSMVNRIRVNWYKNMPQIIRTGMKGVATIRFTIHRDGHITDITVLNSSTIPPYDFSARKAIELSSPLNPLPKDFPNESERVTCMFFYNSTPPPR